MGKFHGIGPKTAEKMNRLGILTGADLRDRPLDFLTAHFGKSGRWYYAISRGEDEREVRPNRTRKSSGSETTFFDDLTEAAAIEAKVLDQADDVWAWCERAKAFGRTVTVKIKYADFQIATRSRSVTVPIDTQAMLQDLSLDLIRSVFPVSRGVRLVGVSVSNFASRQKPATAQMTLALSA